MREKKLFCATLLILIITLSGIGLASVTSKRKTAQLPEYIPVDINSGLAGEIYMPEITEAGSAQAGITGSIAGVANFESTPPVGTSVWDWYLSAISGDTAATMTLRAVVENIEIWVQDDVSFPAGDPRNADPYLTLVSDEMVDYLVEEFNDNIYPIDTSYFGIPQDRDGVGSLFEQWGLPPYWYDYMETDNPQRVVLKVLNYRDTNYFDPTYPYYVIGFFSSTYNGYWDRNIIHLDPWAWWQRVGPEGTQWFDSRPDLIVPANHAHAIEATTTHEYQHLIHADYNPGDADFMNEGCSTFSEWLCGYGVPWNDINSFLATPDNSLTEWGDQGGINILADYGQAFLWAMYLNDRFGSSFLSSFVQAGIKGIAGLDAAMYPYSFNEIYHDWTIANLIHSDKPGHGIYNYKSIDLDDANPVRVYDDMTEVPVPLTMGTDFGNTFTILGYDTGISRIGPYGTDYIVFDWPPGKSAKKKVLYFDGDDYYIQEVNHWEYISELGWYSGSGPDFYDVLAGEAYVDPGNPTLTMTTYWDIEDYWDFGFIQVSTDGGVSWTSLGNEYTTDYHDPNALYNIAKNMPGLTSWSGFITPSGWVTMDFDLSDYAGQDVLIGFRYATDGAVDFPGWYISDTDVSGTALTLAPWTTLGVNFQVSVIWALGGNKHTQYIVRDMDLNDEVNDGSIMIPVSRPHSAYLVISPLLEIGFVDYAFWT
ncbi:MAG: hypothetical protein ACFFCQ_10635 [Promethearchaeota archaeon]